MAYLSQVIADLKQLIPQLNEKIDVMQETQ
jgi:hypothetical protein